MRLASLSMAWRNLGRNKRRTGLALSAIAVGQFALLATMGMMRGYADQIQLAVTGPMLGNVQVHTPDWREERAMDLYLERVEETTGAIRNEAGVADVSARIYAPVLVAPKQDAFTAVVVGLDPQAESQAHGLLSGLKQPLQEGKVLLGYILARKIHVKSGQQIALIGQGADGSVANDLYEVQGIIRTYASLANESGVIMSIEDAQKFLAMPDEAHEIVIWTTKTADSGAVAERLAVAPLLSDAEVLPWNKIAPEWEKMIALALVGGYFVLFLVFIAAAAGVANTMMMSTFERIRELGMLLALGTHPRRIVGMIVVEAVLLGLLGVAVGTALGYAFVFATSSSGIDMASWGGEAVNDFSFAGLTLPLHVFPRLEAFDSILGLLAVILTSLVASAWPSAVAARLEPVEAMRS